ncbi:MAG: hypothetical protein RL346_926 [Verrucomicrobiota bacterium]|jgi:hypothetical protein
MNRRRQDTENRISTFAIFSLVLALAISAVGGVLCVYYRNCQIEAMREIDVVERRIEKHHLDIRTIQMRQDQILNLFAMRKTLKDLGTDMKPIPPGLTENVVPAESNPIAASENNL